MQKAALVFYNTESVRYQILAHGLIDPARLIYAPCGVAPEFAYSPEQAAVEEASPFLLHVGSCIPRKRIDVLLAVFAEARDQTPDLKLIQVGGEWTQQQREQIARLKIGSAIRQMRGLPRRQLAAFYRAAAIVLQTSEAEGFGLPLAEGLACGAVVVASDIPVLREVGRRGRDLPSHRKRRRLGRGSGRVARPAGLGAAARKTVGASAALFMDGARRHSGRKLSPAP